MGQSQLEKAFGLYKKTALITGGGTGLGYAMAECMAAKRKFFTSSSFPKR